VAVRHASQVVGMGESPSQALRRKRDSSLRVVAELVRDGDASAFISAGNTGAAMAVAMFVVGVLRGVDRPAIAAVLPNLKRFAVLLDVGANVDPKPWHLFQFAVMGNVYARDILGIERPRVGLLSVGEEEGKGNELTKEAYEQLKDSSLNFVGNVEGRDIYNGHCDVIVTDGFTGNVALKISESLAEMVGAMIREELMRDVRSRMGATLAKPAFDRFKKRVDYAEMGGAPLLGIDGAAIICHGASPVKAIKNAVRVAGEWAKSGLNDHIKSALENEVTRNDRDEGERA
jgi:glycerol-3-phosphate acyltransferase PlsX